LDQEVARLAQEVKVVVELEVKVVVLGVLPLRLYTLNFVLFY
jgi:hypothetical protein